MGALGSALRGGLSQTGECKVTGCEQRVGDVNLALAQLRNRLLAVRQVQRAIAVYAAVGGGTPLPVMCAAVARSRRGSGAEPGEARPAA
jgi:hypothetical protein